jgi:hypothetical protein
MKKTKTVYLNNMRKIISIVSLTFLFSIISGQESREEAPPLRDRLFYGGNFSLQIGTITDIEVSPVIGLWIRPRIAVAAGPSYSFYKYDQIKTDIFGGKSYIELVVFRDLNKFIPLGINTSLYIHFEDEMLSLNSIYWKNISNPPHRFMVNTVLAGAGLSQQIGTRASINFMVLWTLTDSDPEITSRIYSSPEIRVGFIF